MKAMIWKEWRENIKWGALAFLALVLAITYSTTLGLGLSAYDQRYSNPFDKTAPLTMFLVPLFATALGLLQVGTEMRRDQWAFLMHRPVSRSTIFAGKAVAGLSLYAVATLTPIFLLSLRLQTPGAIAAPFDWHLALAPLADILAGVSFYFAGMLNSVRPARWYGSRALGFATAIGCMATVQFVPEFWQALLASSVFAIALGLAAWGSFLTTGSYERQPKPGKIALGATLFTGIAIVVFMATLSAVQAVAQRQRSANRPDYSRTQYQIDDTGRILRVTTDNGGWGKTGVDLRGHTIKLPKSWGDHLLQGATLINSWDQTDRSNYRSANRYYLNLLPSYDGLPNQTFWFWLKSQKRIVGYSQIDRKIVGSLGIEGYLPIASGLSTPFPEPLYRGEDYAMGNPVHYLRFEHSVYSLDLDERRSALLYLATPPEKIQGAASLNPYAATEDGPIVLVSKDVIHVFAASGKPLFSTPLENMNGQKFNLSIFSSLKNNRFYLWYSPENSGSNNSGPEQLDHISEFSSHGVLVAGHTLPSLRAFYKDRHYQQFWYETAIPVAECPPLIVAAFDAYTTSVYKAHSSSKVGGEPSAETVREIHAFLLETIVVALIFAPITWLVARRGVLSQKTTLGWVVATALLGPFATLLLLALREWPVRVPCPSCGKKRSVNCEKCEHCGALFDTVSLDETSIFEADPDESRLMQMTA